MGVVLSLVLIFGACSGGETDAGPSASASQRGDGAPPEGTRPSAATLPPRDVVLEPAPASLHSSCAQAAAHLGFPVPCPSLVPAVAGVPATCTGSCIGTAGGDETLHQLFFYDVADFDGGESLGPVQHLAIEARRLVDAPPVACFGGAPSGGIDDGTVRLLLCPDRDELSDESAAMIRHGEGAHAGHALGYWDLGGVRYVVSVHGTSDSSRQLIETLIAAVDLVDPPD